MLQMATRVQRLGPNLLLHVPAEPGHHVLRRAPHPLTPDNQVENVGHRRRVHFVRVGVQERGPDRFDVLVVVVEHAFAVVVGRVVLDDSGALELAVVGLGVA